jgi:hypothetical protein
MTQEQLEDELKHMLELFASVDLLIPKLANGLMKEQLGLAKDPAYQMIFTFAVKHNTREYSTDASAFTRDYAQLLDQFLDESFLQPKTRKEWQMYYGREKLNSVYELLVLDVIKFFKLMYVMGKEMKQPFTELDVKEILPQDFNVRKMSTL